MQDEVYLIIALVYVDIKKPIFPPSLENAKCKFYRKQIPQAAKMKKITRQLFKLINNSSSLNKGNSFLGLLECHQTHSFVFDTLR